MSELKIKKNKEKIVKLLNETINLEYDLLLKSLKRVYLKSENIGSKKEPNIIPLKIGVRTEFFEDEDTGEKIEIERNIIIERNGIKTLNGWSEIKYYTIDDV